MEMSDFISLFLLICVIIFIAFKQLPVIVWTIIVGGTLFVLSVIGNLSPIPMAVLWLCFILVAGFANFHSLRQQYFVRPFLNRLKKLMPKISATERIAIEAGDTWWEKELFCGRPNWNNLYKLPQPTLSEEEKQFLDHQVNHLCAMLSDWEIVHDNCNLSTEVWDYLKKEKFFGMVIPKQYGGLGFSALAHSTVVTNIATRSISAAVTTMVPNSLGPAELLLHYGTEEQKNYYLPRLASGIEIPCFALTGPEAGSDAGAIPDSGIVTKEEYEGKEVLGIRLNWDKRYITLAPIATVVGLAFHLYDPQHLLGQKENLGITLCLVPATHPGVEIGNRHFPMALGFMNGPTRGKNVFIPLDWVIGGKEMIGQGWRMLMECLSIGRSISLPALSTACGKITYRYTGAYAHIRRQFNTPIAHFEGVEEALGNIAGYTYLLEACRMMTAGAVDLNINPSIVSAIAKYQMTEMSRMVINNAMDIHAGQMIQVGPRNFLANFHSSVPISITVEGANILTRNLIIFGQGAIRCHPYILQEVELINSPQSDIKELDNLLMAHIGFFVSNLLRTFAYGFTGGVFINTTIKNKKLKKYEQQLTRMSTALALFADMSLIFLGGSLKRRERVSARLGDILSQLYLSSTVLKYFLNHNQPDIDLPNVRWAIQQCLYKIQIAFDELAENFPKGIGKLFKWFIFPWGRSYYAPTDKLTHQIVTPMLSWNELRERLTKFCFVSKNSHDLTFRLDEALKTIATAEPLWKKLHKAVHDGAIPEYYDFSERLDKAKQLNILSVEEAEVLKKFELLKAEIIKVNEFSFDLKRVIA